MVSSERSTIRTPDAHATGRHRREGGRPSGNSRNSRVTIGAIARVHPQLPSHAAHSSAGSDRPRLE